MSGPRVPGATESIELPCGTAIDPTAIDLGMRELTCECGERHAVVTDAHPPTRFLPGALVDVLREIVETDDDFEEFGTPHLLGIVLEEFPGEVAVHEAAEDGRVGYALCWITAFEARRLHEIVVELVVELMDHAMSHAGDDTAVAEFETLLGEFDVEAFVEEYRQTRDLDRPGAGQPPG